MSGRHPIADVPLLTRTELVHDLRQLGVAPGGTIMVHTSMRALGWVVGGPDTVVLGLLDAVGASGTVMAYAGWDQDPYHLDAWPEPAREAARSELPPFDPAISEARRDHGRVPERIRTWPGAIRGPHPEASMVAIGRRAKWLVTPHPDNEPYGDGTPLSRLVEVGGSVLMLGAPLGTATLLHHAETIAPLDKRRVSYAMPITEDGSTIWRTYQDIDTGGGAYDYARLSLDGDPFDMIVREALDSGVGVQGPIGASTSTLLPAEPLVRFAVGWLVDRFGEPT